MGDKGKKRLDNPEQLNRLVANTKIVGDINIGSCLRLDGEIVGNISCSEKLVVGEEGIIKGDIIASQIEVNGLIEGTIKTEDLLVLSHTAVIKGDVYTNRLVIEDGAKIEGNIQTGGKVTLSGNAHKPASEKNKHVKADEEKPSDVVY